MDPIYEQQYKLFLFIINGYEIKIDNIKFPNHIFCFVNDNYIFYYNKENGSLLVDYHQIWSVFEKLFNLNDNQLNNLLSTMVEEHLKLNN